VIGAAEEHSDVINDAYRHCGLYAGSGGAPFATEGASSREPRRFISSWRVANRWKDAAGGRMAGCSKAHRLGRGWLIAWRRARSLAATRIAQARDQLGQRNVDRSHRARGAATVLRRRGGCRRFVGILRIVQRWTPAVAGGHSLSGRMIGLRGGGLADVAGLSAARGTETPESVVALCTDYKAW